MKQYLFAKSRVVIFFINVVKLYALCSGDLIVTALPQSHVVFDGFLFQIRHEPFDGRVSVEHKVEIQIIWQGGRCSGISSPAFFHKRQVEMTSVVGDDQIQIPEDIQISGKRFFLFGSCFCEELMQSALRHAVKPSQDKVVYCRVQPGRFDV